MDYNHRYRDYRCIEPQNILSNKTNITNLRFRHVCFLSSIIIYNQDRIKFN